MGWKSYAALTRTGNSLGKFVLRHPTCRCTWVLRVFSSEDIDNTYRSRPALDGVTTIVFYLQLLTALFRLPPPASKPNLSRGMEGKRANLILRLEDTRLSSRRRGRHAAVQGRAGLRWYEVTQGPGGQIRRPAPGAPVPAGPPRPAGTSMGCAGVRHGLLTRSSGRH